MLVAGVSNGDGSAGKCIGSRNGGGIGAKSFAGNGNAEVGCDVDRLHCHRLRHLTPHISIANVDGRAIGGRCDYRRHTTAFIPRHILHCAPHVFHQFRVVDVGVTVVLEVVGCIITLQFFFAYGVLPMPFQHQIQVPRLIHRIAGAVENGAGGAIAFPRGNFGIVACCHIEVGACKVALVFVVGFPHLATVARSGAIAQAAFAIVAAVGEACAAFTFAIGVAAALIIHVAIGGIHVEEVALHGRCFLKPALRERVLAVHGLTHTAVAFIDTAIVHLILHIAIHINEIAIFGIGVGVSPLKKVVVGNHLRVGRNDGAQL